MLFLDDVRDFPSKENFVCAWQIAVAHKMISVENIRIFVLSILFV
jgi:hypothetical protein